MPPPWPPPARLTRRAARAQVRDKERADCEKLYLKHCLRRALDRAGMSGGATMAVARCETAAPCALG